MLEWKRFEDEFPTERLHVIGAGCMGMLVYSVLKSHNQWKLTVVNDGLSHWAYVDPPTQETSDGYYCRLLEESKDG